MAQSDSALMLIKVCLTDESLYEITQVALEGAAAKGWGKKEIVAFISQHLEERHLYKTMPSRNPPGDIFDVYYCRHNKITWYIKFKRNKTQKRGVIRIVSFKESTRAVMPQSRKQNRRRR